MDILGIFKNAEKDDGGSGAGPHRALELARQSAQSIEELSVLEKPVVFRCTCRYKFAIHYFFLVVGVKPVSCPNCSFEWQINFLRKLAMYSYLKEPKEPVVFVDLTDLKQTSVNVVDE